MLRTASEKTRERVTKESFSLLPHFRSDAADSPWVRCRQTELLRLVRFGLGGTIAAGLQFVSWIRGADFVRSVDWLITRDKIDGPVNLASPNPVPNREFMKALRQAWGTRIGLPAAKWMLEIGTIFLRTETELVLKSRRVIPGRLIEAGFQFQFPEWGSAAQNLVDRWRASVSVE
jgi:hypothetical protein